jgi:hypothetical protein
MNLGEIVFIHTFDDGNNRFKKYLNKWKIEDTMYNGSKLKLINTCDTDIKIVSISTWKTRLCELSQ